MPERFYRSVIFRLLIGILIVILPINILMIVIAQLFFGAMKEQSYKESEHALSLYMDQLDRQLDQTNTFLYKMSSGINYLQLLQADTSTAKKQYEYMKAQTLLLKDTSDMLRDNGFIDGVLIYFADRDEMIVNVNQASYDTDVADFFKDYVREKETSSEPFVGLNWKPQMINGKYYLVHINKKNDSYYGGWIQVSNMIRDFRLNDGEDGYIAFIKGKDGMVMDDVTYEINKDGTYTMEDPSRVISVNYQPIEAPSDKSEVVLIQLIPQNRFVDTIPGIARLLLILSIICLAAIPIIAVILNKQVMAPVRRLMAAMKAVRSGNMDYRIEEKRTTSEFHMLNTSFNHMMEQIKHLRFDVYESRLDKQRIRMEYLSHQIQPHFILNTLNIVYSYDQDEYPLIQQMTMNLIKYFRYIVKVNAPFVPIRQELAHIRTYLDIQSIRYPESFHAHVVCEDELGGCLIPPLVIQSIVENAFKNDFDIEDHMELAVLVEARPGNIVTIRISDTGKGFPQEILEELEIFKNTRQLQPHLGVGIQNTIERLEILYGGISTITFSNNEQGGATIDILIPKFFEDLEE